VGLTILSTLVVIGVLVFVHELGHFIAAKLAGIHVHRFSLGLGAPIPWLSFRRGETEYSVSWLPLGGYVKMASRLEDPVGTALEGSAGHADVAPNRVFEAKPVWVRMVVILAGVVMNLLFAWIVFSGLVYWKGMPVVPTTTVAGVDRSLLPPGAVSLGELQRGDRITAVGPDSVRSWHAFTRAVIGAPADSISISVAGRSPLIVVLAPGSDERRRALTAIRPLLAPVIADVVAGRPGAEAGLTSGDTIVAFNGEPIGEWRDLVSRIESRPGQQVEILIGRSSGRVTIKATPAPYDTTDAVTGATRTIGRLGITGPMLPDAREPVGLVPATIEGARRVGFVFTEIVSIVRGMFSGRVSTREIGGPIAIGMAAGQSARRGAEDFLIFMAAISVNLAVLNLLPIPILDGGQFLFLLAEGITRRPVTGRLREWLTMAGFVAILMLMVLAFSNDIRRLLGI